MFYRTGRDVPRPLNAFNGGRLHVDVLAVITRAFIINQVLNFIVVRRELPIQRSSNPVNSCFPLLRFFGLQIRIGNDASVASISITRCTILLSQRGCQEAGAIRKRCAVTINKFPTRSSLPRTVPAKLFIVVLTARCFQRHGIDLLLTGQVKPCRITFIGISFCRTTGHQLFLLPVHTTANRPVPNLKIVPPLDITLFHIIQRGLTSIATEVIRVVIVFKMLIVSDQLRRIDTGVVSQPGIPGLVVVLSFVITFRRAIHRILIVITVGRVSITTEEAREVLVKLMLHGAPEQFIAIAISVTVTAVSRIRDNIKPLGRLISARRRYHRVTKAFIHRTVISLVAIRTHPGIDLCAFIITHGNDVNHTANSTRSINSRTRATDILNTLHQRDRNLANIDTVGNTRPRHWDPINQHQHMTRFGTTHIEIRAISHATGLRNIDSRQPAHHIIKIFGLPALNILTRNHIGWGQYRINRLLKTGARYHHRVRIAVLRPAGKCRDG